MEWNIRQRGIGNTNPIKLGRCIKKLERIYGIRAGSANKHGTIVGENFSFTQKDLADELGIDVRTMQNYKKLTELVPELQDWVETGILTPTTAIALIKYMSPSEQEDGSWVDARTLHKELGVGKDFTNWIKGRINKYEFIENEDWKLTFAKTGERKNVKVNCYSLTLDMAKELSMVENNKIGRISRKYFIAIDKAFKARRLWNIDRWETLEHYKNYRKIINLSKKELMPTMPDWCKKRGDIGGSAKKTGKRIKELERLYGIEYGNNQHNRTSNNFNSSKTQEQLAKDMGMTVQNLQNYKLLADMIPELDELVETGIVTKTTALAMMRNLSKQEQIDIKIPSQLKNEDTEASSS